VDAIFPSTVFPYYISASEKADENILMNLITDVNS